MADIVAAKAAIHTHLRSEEGEKFYPYLCSAGKPTIGVGCTTYEDGRKVTLADPPIDARRSAALLTFHIDKGIERVMVACKGMASTNQLIALVICGFNIGWEALEGSTMIKRHVAGDYIGAARAFQLWDKYHPYKGAPLQVHPVLHARRLREAAIYATPDGHADEPAPVPQAVAPQPPLASSPTVQVSTLGVATAAIKAVSDQVDAIKGPLTTVRDAAHDWFDVPPDWVPWVLLAGICCTVLWRRWKQRQEGRA
jgi:lysozyme